MRLVKFNSDHIQLWDDFILHCPMATFLHSRKFLSYHGEKYLEKSYLIFDDEKLLGIFPAAVSLTENNIVISHPGITYGGILHQGKLLGEKMVKAIGLLIERYKEEGYSELLYKAVPYFYHQTPASDDLYALFVYHGVLYRRDLSCLIDVRELSVLSNKAQAKISNAMKKAEASNVTISTNLANLEEFWLLLTKHLQEKYQTKPVHDFAEINLLINRFPENIQLVLAINKGKILAGTLLFIDNGVMHTQYLVVTPEGAEKVALDFVIQFCIKKAKEEKLRYFNFGISTEDQGNYLNQGLYFSKTKHGGAGAVHDFYKISLV